MKTYIIICAFADKIAGGPIYNANKVRYKKEKGWNVVVVRTDVGTRAAIPGLRSILRTSYLKLVISLQNLLSAKERNYSKFY